MSFHVEDENQFPTVFHPIVARPFRNNRRRLDVWQVRPGRLHDAATWCGGTVTVTDNGPHIELPNGEIAALGDFLVWDGIIHRVEPADGAAHRIWPAGQDDGTDPPLLHPAT